MLVAIHRVVAPADRRDPFDRQERQVVCGGVRRDVPAVRERMDPGLVRREAQQRLEVIDVRVDAAVRDEPEQVDALTAGKGVLEDRVLEEAAFLDSPCSRA